MDIIQPSIKNITAMVDRLRPASRTDIASAEANIRQEIQRLSLRPEEATLLRNDLQILLSLPRQAPFYAESGVQSSLGFALELKRKISQRLLPPPSNDHQLVYILRRIFRRPGDHIWVCGVSDDVWLELAHAIGIENMKSAAATYNLLEAVRVLSYRISGAALDRELLQADQSLELFESPFLAQNAVLTPMLERARQNDNRLTRDEVREVDVLLDQCLTVLTRTNKRAQESGISVRLTYLMARLQQMLARLRCLLELVAEEQRLLPALKLMKTLVQAAQTDHYIRQYLSSNINLIALNITDRAGQHGEHYIAENRNAWLAMGRSAAGGGIIIAFMAMFKIQLATLHLPPLTEGIAYGLNYAIGFVLIYLLGFTVATKQPAMTAAAIAATLEESHPKEMEKLGDLVQNVVRTQFIAVLGNVSLALPVACLIVAVWPLIYGHTLVSPEKAVHLLQEIHPIHSGALFFAAVAGLGLFLSGLISGYFDNQARYHKLAARIADAPKLAWLGKARTEKLGRYLDLHYGGILGNFFFGMYLGLVGVVSALTGLPIDIRHVAFASANVGTATTTLGFSDQLLALLPWAIAGVIGIALVNLLVSFLLALYVALKSRRMNMSDVFPLAVLLVKRFCRKPFSFFSPPVKTEGQEKEEQTH